MTPQLKPFKAVAPPDFREKMIVYWMKGEKINRGAAMSFYGGKSFEKFCKRLVGEVREYKPDISIWEPGPSLDCFEKVDNNFVIPIHILEPINGQ